MDASKGPTVGMDSYLSYIVAFLEVNGMFLFALPALRTIQMETSLVGEHVAFWAAGSTQITDHRFFFNPGTPEHPISG